MSATPTNSRPLPRPLRLVSNSIGSPLSPLSAPIHVSPLSASNDTVTSSPKPRSTQRRQSSISYNTSSTSPKSPTPKRHSIGAKAVDVRILDIQKESGNNAKLDSLLSVRETEPKTLAEKHVDLLRFIAQKEAKCLELRTQLAQHEGDLLVLKRKWERIVSKGLPQSSRQDSTHVASEMLEGIRGGVQSSFEKVLAVLEPGAMENHSPQSSPTPFMLSSSAYAPHDVFPLTSKRISISSTSTHDRSSLTGSRSSRSSLFDDVSSFGDQSLDSSIGEESATILATEKLSNRRNSSSLLVPTAAPSKDALSPKTSSGSRLSQLPSLGASEALAPLGKQMANWIPPAINKKWEELKENETISKQSKRASVLFNDMFATLSGPTPGTLSKVSSFFDNKPPNTTPNSRAVDSTLLGLDSLPTISSNSGARSKQSDPWLWLLDDDQYNGCPTSSILQPEVLKVNPEHKVDATKKEEDDNNDDEEWNW